MSAGQWRWLRVLLAGFRSGARHDRRTLTGGPRWPERAPTHRPTQRALRGSLAGVEAGAWPYFVANAAGVARATLAPPPAPIPPPFAHSALLLFLPRLPTVAEHTRLWAGGHRVLLGAVSVHWSGRGAIGRCGRWVRGRGCRALFAAPISIFFSSLFCLSLGLPCAVGPIRALVSVRTHGRQQRRPRTPPAERVWAGGGGGGATSRQIRCGRHSGRWSHRGVGCLRELYVRSAVAVG